MFIKLSNKDMNKKIYELCQSHNDTMKPTILLSKYEYDKELMQNCEKVPFIIRQGKYEWNVDLKSITVAEYFRTFPCYGDLIVEFETENFYSNALVVGLENSKKYFQTFMKNTYKEWRDVQCSFFEKKLFFRKIMQYGVSPMSVVQAIYSESSYYLQDFCRIFLCAEKEGRAILKALGFRSMNVRDYYEKENSFEEAVLNTCDMAENCNIETKSGCRANIEHIVCDGLYKVYRFCGKCVQRLEVRTNPTTQRIELAKGERKKVWETVIIWGFIFLILCGIIFSILLGKSYIQTMLQNKEYGLWASNASTFFGAVIGGLFSSIATIVTTYLVIRRGYKVDYHQERLGVMPVFSAECFIGNQISVKKNQYKKEKGYGIQIEVHASEENPQLIILKNIGNGIAFNIEMRRYPKESEPMYLNTMEPSVEKGVMYECIDWRRVILDYSDIHGNRYIQYINIYERDGNMITKVEQPELIVRTKRIRYVQ